MIKAVIFDLDGTLLDTLDDLRGAVNHALSLHSMPERSIQDIRRFVGNGVRRLVELSVPGGEANPEFEAVLSDFKKYYSIHSLDLTRPYEGILEALAQLKERGLSMAIVSNKLESATEQLRLHFFGDFIKTAVGDDPSRRRKPAPDGVFEAMKRLDVQADECIFVGDSDVDFQTAVNAGLRCISVLWGYRSKEDLKKVGAKVFCPTPSALAEMI